MQPAQHGCWCFSCDTFEGESDASASVTHCHCSGVRGVCQRALRASCAQPCRSRRSRESDASDASEASDHSRSRRRHAACIRADARSTLGRQSSFFVQSSNLKKWPARRHLRDRHLSISSASLNSRSVRRLPVVRRTPPTATSTTKPPVETRKRGTWACLWSVSCEVLDVLREVQDCGLFFTTIE